MSHTRAELFEIAIRAFDGRANKMFRSIPFVEHLPLFWLKRISTYGTVLAPIVRALNIAGASTDSTVGGVMETLNMNRSQLHRLVCFCNHGTGIAGSCVVTSLRIIANS